MSTMKKLFALVLALAMMMSVAVFANAYGDSESISAKCKDAVEILSAIGLVEGDNHGNFNPENTITRAEAAAIIYRLRNGGVDDKAAKWVGAEPFADVTDGEWYAGYVAWCYNYGIIDGVSATAFNPKQPIKGTELAKMLLATAGYKSASEGYTGAGWEKNVIEDATAAGLFDNYGIAFTNPCARQWAALMIVNALNVEEAEYLGDYRLPTTGETLGKKYLSLADYKNMIVIANDTWSIVHGGTTTSTVIHSDKPGYEKEAYTYTAESSKASKDSVKLATAADIAAYKAGTLTFAQFKAKCVEFKYDDTTGALVGKEVKVVSKLDGKVIGFVATGKGTSGTLTITKDTDGKYTAKMGDTVVLSAKAGTTALTKAAYDATTGQNWYCDETGDPITNVTSGTGMGDMKTVYGADVLTVEGYYNTLYNFDREGSFTAYDFESDGKVDAVVSNINQYAKCTYNSDSKKNNGTYYIDPNDYSKGAASFGFFITDNASMDACGGWHTGATFGISSTTYIDGQADKLRVVDAMYKIEYDYVTNKRVITLVNANAGILEEIIYANDAKTAIKAIVVGGETYQFVTGGLRNYANKNIAMGSSTAAHVNTIKGMLGVKVNVYADSFGNIVDLKLPATSPNTPAGPGALDTSKLAYVIAKGEKKSDKLVEDEWGTVTVIPEGNVEYMVKVMYANGTTETIKYDTTSTLTGIEAYSSVEAGVLYEVVETSKGYVFNTNLSEVTDAIYGSKTAKGSVAAESATKALTYNYAKGRFIDANSKEYLVNGSELVFVKYVKSGKDQFRVMKMSEFTNGLAADQQFNLVAYDTAVIPTVKVLTVEFAGNLPSAIETPDEPGKYLVCVTSALSDVNLGVDADNNNAPVNGFKFEAIDMLTGVKGVYLIKDTTIDVSDIEIGNIIGGELDADSYITKADAISGSKFAGTLAEGWYYAEVEDKLGDIMLLNGTLIDSDDYAKNMKVMKVVMGEDAPESFTAITLNDVKASTDKVVTQLSFKVDAEGNIALIYVVEVEGGLI